jgi:hypothetical protein
MLYEFITVNRTEIITRCRAKVATRLMPLPSAAEINHGVPLFLEQFVAILRSGGTSTPEIDQSAGQHGHDLLLRGFTTMGTSARRSPIWQWKRMRRSARKTSVR